MFTPSELLKHYLKEAFDRELVPASDDRIKTWNSFRSDLACNNLDILKSANGGKFTQRLNLFYSLTMWCIMHVGGMEHLKSFIGNACWSSSVKAVCKSSSHQEAKQNSSI